MGFQNHNRWRCWLGLKYGLERLDGYGVTVYGRPSAV